MVDPLSSISSNSSSNPYWAPKIIDQTGFSWLPNQILRIQDKRRDGLSDDFVVSEITQNNTVYHNMDLDPGKSMLRILNTTKKKLLFSHFGTPIILHPKSGRMMYPSSSSKKMTNKKIRKRIQFVSDAVSSQKNDRNATNRASFSNHILRYRYILDDERWLYHYQRLEAFRQNNGHCRVPQRATNCSKEDRTLAIWVAKQRWMNSRREEKGGRMRSHHLTDERKRLLEKIQFEFDINIGWADSYNLLVQYFQTYGHCRVVQQRPSSTAVNGDEGSAYDTLIYWVRMQRQQFRQGKLSPRRISLLNAIQFDWDPQRTNWDKQYQKLKLFFEQNGHSHVPNSERNKSLYLWTQVQRRAMCKFLNHDNLDLWTRERIQKLNTIQFDWKPSETMWTEKYQQLCNFYERHGHSNVPLWKVSDLRKDSLKTKKDSSSPKNYVVNPLGQWCRSLRRHYREWMRCQQKQGGECSTIHMNRERIELLEKVDFDFSYNAVEESWQCRFQELKEFHERNGHCRVPIGYKANPQLAFWVRQQRLLLKEGSSRYQERIDLLNSIHFSWIPFDSQWEQRYCELREFKNEHGHVNISSKDNPKLASWITTQRKQFRQRMASLEEKSEATTTAIVIANRFSLLTQLGLSLDPTSQLWMEQYSELKNFLKENGHTRVPRFYKADPSLGMWVSNQRRKKKDGCLSNERQQMLNDLGFEWVLK